MSSNLLNTLRVLRGRVNPRPTALRLFKGPQRKSFVHSFTRKFSSQASNSIINSSSESSSFWYPLIAAPFAYAAFWATSDNDNTLEKANEDIEKLAFALNDPDESTAELATLVIAKILALPNNQLRRDTMYVLAAVSTAAKVIAEVGPESAEAKDAVMQAYALAQRISSDSHQPEEMKLDALRCAHKAEYFVFMFRNDYVGMKAVLEKDLRVVKEHFRKLNAKSMSFEESAALFSLASVLGYTDDPKTKDVLEESLQIFKGVTKENITPELERTMIERIVSSLSLSFTLDLEEHKAASKEFGRIALALYEQFPRVAVHNTEMPSWKQLETQVKQSTLASGPL